MAITLYKFGAQWGISDPSPFCVKLESFLRLNDLAYTLGDFDVKSTIGKSPKKKIPFVVLENGQDLGDSTLIIERLSQDKNIDMDAPLSDEQRAISYAYRRMIDEALYFNLLYARWVDDAGWNVIKPLFFSEGAPAFLLNIISKKIRKDVTKTTYLQGTARHSKEEVYDFAHKDLLSLSTLLGDNTYFFGMDKPTLLDIWCHASVINIIEPPIENIVKERTLKLDNLVKHAHHMQSLIYGNTEQAQAA